MEVTREGSWNVSVPRKWMNKEVMRTHFKRKRNNCRHGFYNDVHYPSGIIKIAGLWV
jgi:hypothetical protein